MAMGSVRSCQAILCLAELTGTASLSILDSVAAQLYTLLRAGPYGPGSSENGY